MHGIGQKEPTEACRKEEGRMQNAELGGGWRSGGRWQRPVPEATEADEGDPVCRFRSIKMIRSHPITSDQIKPNPTKKKRSSPDQGAGRSIKTGADEPRFRSSALDAGKC